MPGSGGYQPFSSARRSQRGLQATEAEVQGVLDPWPWEAGLFSFAHRRHPLYLRAAGEAESKHPGALVERLSRCVVAGAREQGVGAVVFHQDEVGVAAGGDQADEGEAGGDLRVGILQPRCVDVALQVVYAEQGQTGGERQPLGGVDADEQRSGETGAVGHGDAVEVGQLDASVLQGPADHGDYGEEMLPGGGFGDDAAEAGVEVRLGGDDVGDYPAAVLDDGDGRLVAGGLDAQESHSPVTGGKCRRPRR